MDLSNRYFEEATANIDIIHAQYKEMEEYWSSAKEFHESFHIYDEILEVRKNVKLVLEQIQDFLNISAQLEDLSALADDPASFEFVQVKLINMEEMKMSIQSKMKGGKESEALAAFQKQFDELDRFIEAFNHKIFANIANCIELSQKDPKTLLKSLKLVENADKVLESKGKPPRFFEKCKEFLKKSIKGRFDKMFSNCSELEAFLQTAKESVNDLVEVYTNCTKLFPERYKIFEFWEGIYKECIEEKLLPLLSEEEKMKENPGNVIILMSWLDEYEALLNDFGASVGDYSVLKAVKRSFPFVFTKTVVRSKQKIKSFMPFFMEHIESLMKEWIAKIFRLDRENQTLPKLSELEASGADIESNFPEDLFTFLNKQLDLIGGKMKGEAFLEVLKVRLPSDYWESMVDGLVFGLVVVE